MTWHTGRMAALHLHTTGLDAETARIVIADLVLVGGGQDADTRTWLLNPGIPIPSEATKIHGITTDQARAQGTDPQEGVAQISRDLSTIISEQIPLVVFRAPYALTIFDRECHRHRLPVPGGASGAGLRSVIDPLVLDKHIDQFRRGSRTLRALCTHHRVRHDGNNNPASDALAAARLAWRLGNTYPQLRSLDITTLHDRQVIWAAEQAKSFQEHLRQKDPKAVVDGAWPITPQTTS
ncbi:MULTISPECIES: exonuclease domain-containing protein [Streptomyces]|uniref:exonuclease domain-containing protein n=1 Tax=Streptomyces lycopersici TaxID=2974589 RepID=UPI0021CE38BA|nr:exonuclease domain-containing protein [Streptomyces sp. NEAU-383]